MIEIKGTLGREMKKQFEENVPDSILAKKMKTNDIAALTKNGSKWRKARGLDEVHKNVDQVREVVVGKKDFEEYKNQVKNEILEDLEKQLQVAIENLDKNAEILIRRRIEEAKEKANLLARQYGLAEPNNPEALKFDRLHCYTCGMGLHWKNAYKNAPEEVQALFGNDEEVRHLCCFCFAKLDSDEIVQVTKGESDREIRMMVYDPASIIVPKTEEEIANLKGEEKRRFEEHKKNVDSMTADRVKYIESKIRRYNGISLIGKFKYSSIEGEDLVVNNWLAKFPTRYDYANN